MESTPAPRHLRGALIEKGNSGMLDTSKPPQSEFFSPPPAEPAQTQPRHGGSGRGRAILGLTLAVVAASVIGGFAGRVIAGPTSTTAARTSSTPSTAGTIDAIREAVVTQVKPAVVEVTVTLANGSALGSGVVIDSRGYIVTNNHVVSGALSVQVILSNGAKEAGQVAGTDPANDLADVKIAVPPGGLSVATLGVSSQLHVGQQVLAIGNPLGDTETVTSGIVSALKRSVSEGPGGPTIQNAIQTDAAINPGNSGGALVDVQGRVVGIPTLSAIDPEFNALANGVGFAIPSNRVQSIMAHHRGFSNYLLSSRNVAAAAVSGYTTAFAVAAGVFFAGAFIAATVYTGRSVAPVQKGATAVAS
jgi:S1-C subfamily serine protease